MAGDDMFAPLICDEDLEFGARQLFRLFLIFALYFFGDLYAVCNYKMV